MTKKVRIEDADSGEHFKVTVQVWNKGASGPAEGENEPDTLSSETTLFGPTDLCERWIHSTQYIVIKEAAS